MPATKRSGEPFTEEERAAMKERAREARKRSSDPEAAARELLDKIAEMEGSDRVMAEKVHEIVTAIAPGLTPRLWYGMPAYAKDGKVLVFFQDAKKFKARYATIGFNDAAALDDGAMWATSFALTEVTPEVEQRIAALVEQAAR